MAGQEISKTTGSAVGRPGDVFGAMRDEMDRLFERFELGWPRWPAALDRPIARTGLVPELDVRDNGKQMTIEVELPGVDEKDVHVTVANGMLTIKGEKKTSREEKDESYFVSERSYGAFQRSLRLPETVDEGKLEARFDKGVLMITAPKKPEAVKTERKVEIKGN